MHCSIPDDSSEAHEWLWAEALLQGQFDQMGNPTSLINQWTNKWICLLKKNAKALWATVATCSSCWIYKSRRTSRLSTRSVWMDGRSQWGDAILRTLPGHKQIPLNPWGTIGERTGTKPSPESSNWKEMEKREEMTLWATSSPSLQQT